MEAKKEYPNKEFILTLLLICCIGLIVWYNWFSFYSLTQPVKINLTDFDECKGNALIQTTNCVWDILANSSQYESLRNLEKSCKQWTYTYSKIAKYLGYKVKVVGLMTKSNKFPYFSGHVFPIYYNNEGYCVMEQTLEPEYYRVDIGND